MRFNLPQGYQCNLFESIFLGLSTGSPQNDNVSFLGVKMSAMLLERRDKKIVQLHYLGDYIITIEKYLDAGIITMLSYNITFHGAYFYIPAIKGLMNKFIRVYHKNLIVSILDIALDVKRSTNDLNANYSTISDRYSEERKGDHLETFYIGQRYDAKRHFIICYDKLLDSSVKGKYHLFAHYFLEKTPVSRIELKMRVLSIKNYSIYPLDVTENLTRSGKLWEVYKQCCLNPKQTDFRLILTPKKPIKLFTRMERQSEVLDNFAYARRMLGYARTLKEYGFDPIEYLRSSFEAEDIESRRRSESKAKSDKVF